VSFVEAYIINKNFKNMSFENPFGKTNIPKSDAEKKADELKDGVVKMLLMIN